MTFAQNTANMLPDSGNVGLGVSTPTCKLQVNGHTHLMSNVKIDSSLMISDSAKVGNNLKIGGSAYIQGNLNVNGTTSFNDSVSLNYLNDATQSYKMLVLTPNGNIESGPKLGWPPLPNCDTNIIWPFIQIGNATPPFGNLALCPTYDKMGVGTLTPQAKIDISTNTETGLIVGSYQGNNWGYGIISKVSNNTTKAFAVQHVQFINNNAISNDEFVVYGDGKAGIKTDNIDANLTVNGIDNNTKAITIRQGNGTNAPDQFVVYGDGHCYAREFTAELNTFVHPDYVFKKNYKLMPLDALDKFVTEHHHLPNIPSTKQVKANGGINVGAMEEKLLQKVEELTLYTIQLQKEVDELKKQVKKQ